MSEKKPKKKVVTAAFGQEVDLSDLEGFDIQELLAANTDLLKIENGDPNFEYGWMDVRDPMHAYKIRKGLWEAVNVEEDQVICAGSVVDGKTVRVNELMLVKMPKVRFQKIRLAWDAISLAKETKIAQRFQGEMNAAGQALGDDPEAAMTSTDKVGVTVKYAGKEK